MTKEKNVNLDILRVLSMIMVICSHTYPRLLESSPLAVSIQDAIFTLCNGCFFMLSGYFNLSGKFSDREDWERFFAKRAVTVVLPFLLVIIVKYFFDKIVLSELLECIRGNGVTLANILESNGITFRDFYEWLMYKYAGTHLWFVYILIGFLLSTPLLAKALQNMTDKELDLLLVICIIWNVFEVYLTADFDVDFSYCGWVLSGWTASYFAGYYCRRRVNDNNKRKFYIFGAVGFIVTVLCVWLIPEHYKNPAYNAPAYLLYSMAVFIYFQTCRKQRNAATKKVIAFLSGYSYLVYLMHINVLECVIPKLDAILVANPSLLWIEKVVLTLVITVLLGMAVNLVLSPLQKVLLRKIDKKYGNRSLKTE